MMLSRSGWRLPPENRPSLAEDEVHVWRASLEQPAEFAASLESILASDERERVRRFYFDRDRRRCLISRGLLRTLLGRYLDLPPRALRFDYSPFGKPSLAGTPLQFNVSHSGELLLIAIAHDRAIGVDIEQIRPKMSVVEIAQRFFSASERTALAALAEPLQHDAFFTCWTRKEAYIKARGEGLSFPLDDFDVAFLPGEAARLLETRPDPAEARRWCLRELDVADGYKAALAVEGSEWTLKCWDRPESHRG